MSEIRNSLTAQASSVRFSIVIPAKNAASVLGKCLDSLVNLDPTAGGFEVIVVDNGSSDQTFSLASSYIDSLSLKVIERPQGFVSALRNYGASLAQGTVLVFLDADCIAPQNWLVNASMLCSQKAINGAFYRTPPRSSWVARAWHSCEYLEKEGAVSFVPAGNLIVPKDVFEKIGGFDETLETNEDYEICQRALCAGYGVFAFPSLAVIHLGNPQTLNAFYRKERWHGKHVLAVTLRSLPAVRNAKAIFYAAYMLLCLIGILLGGVLNVVKGRWEPLLAAIFAFLLAPTVLSFRLVIRRKRWADLLPLYLLFTAYGMARASCLLDISSFFPRQSTSRTENMA